MIDFRPPWLFSRSVTSSSPPALDTAELAPPETPAVRLLLAHLQHGSVARREAAAFALVLTRPEPARAIADFFTARRSGPGRG